LFYVVFAAAVGANIYVDVVHNRRAVVGKRAIEFKKVEQLNLKKVE
tara:strand:+ start:71 stop:208 length:138 start_codon:yes stop_codon:yes gene_type:complete